MKNRKILVVDDDKGERDLFTRILKKNGCDVESSKSGEEALKKLKMKSFNMVLADIVMPKMDGIQLLDKIKKTNLHRKDEFATEGNEVW